MRLRILALLMAIMMIAALAAGCSKPATEPAPPQPAAGGGEQPAPAPAPEPAAKEKLKVAFIYVGPIGDAGWTWAHEQGRVQLEQELGDQVEAVYIESVPEGADSERVMEEQIQQGAKVIFATSFGYMDPMLKLAQKYPDVYFFHCSGFKDNPNMSTYFGRIEQPRYLSGIVAGMQTKTNVLGYVAAFPIPEVIRGINAFTLGARSVNPNVKVKVVWTSTWYDPAKEKDAALSLLDAGADVIAQHQDTPGPAQAAQERNVWAVGYNSDFRQHAPKSFLTAPVWNWGPYYVRAVQSVLDGTFKSEQYWGPMSDGIVDLAPLAEFAPAGAQAKVDEVKAKMLAGTFDWHYGPIKDQTGAERVPAGGTISDGDQLGMMWFVEGVEGTIPQ